MGKVGVGPEVAIGGKKPNLPQPNGYIAKGRSVRLASIGPPVWLP